MANPNPPKAKQNGNDIEDTADIGHLTHWIRMLHYYPIAHNIGFRFTRTATFVGQAQIGTHE